MRKIIIILLAVVYCFTTLSQIAVGEWRDQLSYVSASHVEVTPNRTYCLTTGGLFYIDERTNSVNKLTKVNILSDVNATYIKYSPKHNYLIVGYQNGNVDLLINNGKVNIPDIKNKQMMGVKRINHIFIKDDYAYLSTGFGIVVVNIPRKEIKETYIIGSQGAYLAVNAFDADNSHFWAATDAGVYRAEISEPNLVDFAKWERILNIPQNNKRYNAIACFNGKVYASYDNSAWDQDTLYVYDYNSWSSHNLPLHNILAISKSNKSISIIQTYNFLHIKDNGQEMYYYSWINNSSSPRDVVFDENDNIWIADNSYGLVYRRSGDNSYSNVIPNGPSGTRAFAIASEGNKVISVAGGRSNSWGNLWLQGRYYIFENEMWSNYSPANIDALSSMPDLTSIAINPNNPNNYFIASYGGGVLEMNGNQFVQKWDQSNSSLMNIDTSNSTPYTRIGGLTFDREGNLWVTNCVVNNSISVKKKNGGWKGFNLRNYIGVSDIGQIISTVNNHKWVVLPRGNGLFVFSDNGTIDNIDDDEYKKISVIDQNGELISNDIYSIAEDNNGRIWLGTNKGVVVYYYPENVFSGNQFYASQIKLPNENPGQANYLLESQTITAIAVDGANRKWFGTSNGGVFLMSPDGLEEILNFTEENSPLFSNNILDIAINHVSGEIFLVTENGIVSYRGTATAGDDYLRNVYAFPNPVPPDYHGPISIKGLATNVNVKITDITGNLVFETIAEGGQAIWYGKTLSGNDVRSGVYLAFATNEDGTRTEIAKILLVR